MRLIKPIFATLQSLAIALAALSAQLQTVRAQELYNPSDSLPQIAAEISDAYGLNTPLFLKVITCESGFNSNAVGDLGTSFGLAQIHLPAHPEITEQEAEDPIFSLKFMADEWRANHESEWTCYTELTKS